MLTDKIKKQIHEANDTHEALNTTLAVASVGIATLNMLETLLPAAASEVERESKDLSECFMTLAHYIEMQGSKAPEAVTDAINDIITGMQFQDRNTQIMHNVAVILERYRSMLEDICNNIENLRNDNPDNEHRIAIAVDHILSGIRMSDIRSRYVEALKKAKVHKGDTGALDKSGLNNDIELF